MNTKIWKAILALPTLCGLILLAGCGKKESTEEQPAATPSAAAPAATPIDPATTATVSGTLKLDGEAPKAAKIALTPTPASQDTHIPKHSMPTTSHFPHSSVHV